MCDSDFIILVGFRISDVNLDSQDYNDDYLAENQNKSDAKFICEEAEEHWDVSGEDILRDFNDKSSLESNDPVR